MIPVAIYLLKVKERNTRTMSEICSKLTIKTPERRQAFSDSQISMKLFSSSKLAIETLGKGEKYVQS